MSLSAADIALVVSDINVTVVLTGLIPTGSTVQAQLDVIAPRIWSEMQLALRPRYGALADPLPDDLRHVLVIGCIAELMFLAYRNLGEDEKAWPDEWRKRFTDALSALAAGVDTLEEPVTTGAFYATSEDRVFTLDGFKSV